MEAYFPSLNYRNLPYIPRHLRDLPGIPQGLQDMFPVTYQYPFLYCPLFFRHYYQHTPVWCEWMFPWVCPIPSLYLGVLQYSLYFGSELPDDSPLKWISEIYGQHISFRAVFYLQVSHCNLIFNKKISDAYVIFSITTWWPTIVLGENGTDVVLLHNHLFHIKLFHLNRLSLP